MAYYRVKNESIVPVLMTWTRSLLSDDDLVAYEEFKQSVDYIGRTEEDIAQRRRLPEALKARPFLARLGKDVQVPVYDKNQQGDTVVTEPRMEWKFSIGPDPDAIMRSSIVDIQDVCDQFSLPYRIDHTLEDLSRILVEAFGSNVRVLTDRQWLESGLQSREKRELTIRSKDTGKRIVVGHEGYLVATKLSEVEARELERQLNSDRATKDEEERGKDKLISELQQELEEIKKRNEDREREELKESIKKLEAEEKEIKKAANGKKSS